MRLFVAVGFSASLRRALDGVASELSAEAVPVRWTPRANFHLTLRWLGDSDGAARDSARRVIADVASRTSPFQASFGSVGAFPSPRRPRVIWIAVEPTPRLRVLRDELERGLAAAGFDRDVRSFRPHVTLGRAGNDAAPGDFRPFVARSRDLGLADEFPVHAIDLMRSRNGEDGARYERLARSSLTG